MNTFFFIFPSILHAFHIVCALRCIVCVSLHLLLFPPRLLETTKEYGTTQCYGFRASPYDLHAAFGWTGIYLTNLYRNNRHNSCYAMQAYGVLSRISFHGVTIDGVGAKLHQRDVINIGHTTLLSRLWLLFLPPPPFSDSF